MPDKPTVQDAVQDEISAQPPARGRPGKVATHGRRRKVLVVAAVAGVVTAGGVGTAVALGGKSHQSTGTPAAASGQTIKNDPTFKISTITASFEQSTFSTSYGVTVSPLIPADQLHVRAQWTLQLQLVDPAGKPNPGVPGSGAAVDFDCDNSGLGLPGKPLEGGPDSVFVWVHPDPGSKFPQYHCHHVDMGPSGHQGLITVVVSQQNGPWQCQASYKGTNSSTSRDVEIGVSSQPTCSKVGS